MNEPTQGSEAAKPAEPVAKPRGRWKKVLLISGGAFLGLVLSILLFGPALAASIARSQIESSLAERLRAQVDIADLSLSWSGAVSMSGLRIVPEGFETPMVEVPEVRAKIAIVSALGGRYLAEVEVVGPRVVIEKNSEGRFNYEVPPGPEKEPPPKSTEGEKPVSKEREMPFVDAHLTVRGGEVVLRAEGAETVLRALSIDVDIDGLENPIAYSLAFEDPAGGRFRLQGSHESESHRGPFSVALENLSLANFTGVLRAYTPVRSLGGKLNGELSYEMKGVTAFAGTGRLELEGTAELRDGTTISLEGVRLDHSGELDDSGDGRHNLSFQGGKALSLSLQTEIRDAFGTPKATTTFSAQGDLSELGRMLERSIGLKPGFALAGSAGVRGAITSNGFDEVSFDLGAEAKDLVAVDGKGRRHEIDPRIDLKAVGSWHGPKRSVELSEFGFTSSFADAKAKGGATLADPIAIRNSSMSAEVKLDELSSRLATFLEDPPVLGGTASLQGTFAGERFDLTLEGNDVAFTRKVDGSPSTFGPLDATLIQKGVLEARPGGALRIEKGSIATAAFSADVTGEIQAVFEESRKGTLSIKAGVVPAELSRFLEGLELGGPAVRVSASVSVQGVSASVDGEAGLDGLTMGKGAELQTIKAATLKFSAKQEGEDLGLTANAPRVEWSRAGYLLSAGVEASLLHGGAVTSGTTTVKGLIVTDPARRTVTEEKVVLRHEIHRAEGAIEIRKLEVESGLLTGQVGGRIGFSEEGTTFEGIKGSFKYQPSRLGAVLAPWLPGQLEGEGERTLEVTLDGKAKEMDLFAILRGSTGGADLDLARYTSTGLALAGRTNLKLKDGLLTGRAPLDVNEGKTDLDLSLDFGGKSRTPKSTLSFKADGVKANGSMGPLLSKVSPLLYVHGVDAALDGVVHSKFDFAWDGPIDGDAESLWAATPDRLTGRGKLAIQKLSIRGSPIVGQLLDALAATGNDAEGELLPTDIVVEGGKCRYRDMTLRLKRYQVKFTGWVAFDGTMHLTAETPITEKLAERYPALRKYFGKTLFLPLTGTVKSPRVDWGGAIQEFLKRNAPALVEDLLDKALKKLLKDRKK